MLDTTTNSVSATVTAGTNPVNVAFNPAGTRAFVTNMGSADISVFDTATHSLVATIPVGAAPRGIVFNPAGGVAYVANANVNTVSVINTSRDTVKTTVAVGAYPVGVAIDPAGTRVYVANYLGNTVSVIDTANNSVVATVTVGTNPFGVAVNPQGTEVYVSNYGSTTLSIINPGTNTVSSTFTVGHGPGLQPDSIVAPFAGATTGVAFTDTYPAGLVNTASASPASTCGGTVTAANGGNSLALSGGTIPANDSCIVTVNVTSAAVGTYVNSTGAITTGNAGTGAAVSGTLTVSGVPPAVSITTPANNATFNAPAAIPIVATATDVDAALTKVEFYQGASLLGTVTTGGSGNNGSSYSFTWANVAAGSYALTAKAYDGAGATATSNAANVTVCGPPGVAIISPMAGQRTLPPGTFALAVSAGTPAACGPITRVDYYAGATLVASGSTPPTFAATWSNIPVGAYSLTARAYAASGLSAISAAINVTVDTPPTVTITAPASNAQLTMPGPFTLSATATDANPGGSISKVEFLVNNAVVGSTAASPYKFSWTPAAVGTCSIAARATDNLGGVTTSAAVSVTVANGPTVTLTAPSPGKSVSPGTAVSVVANPVTDTADGRGVANVVLAAKNSAGSTVWSVTIGGCSNNCAGGGNPFVGTFTPSVAGGYILTATVTDTGGATAVSPSVTLFAGAPPSVSVTSDRSTYLTPATIHLTATATDPYGTVQSVVFYSNGSQVGAGTAGGTNTWLLTYSNNVAGTYAITAQATDNLGFTATSAPLTISIVQSGSTTVYYHNDFEGSPLAATDAQGNVVWHETYAPYGERYLNQDTATRNGLWYNGKPTEDSSGLSYYGGRWYNPVMGRFYSADPQRFKDSNPLSFNRYAYANNNPYRFVDPNGQSPFDIGFLIWDLGKLGVALYNGSGVGDAAIGVGFSAIGAIAPIPGVGLALKAARTAEHVAEAARIAEHVTEAASAATAVERSAVGIGEYAGESIAARSAARDFTAAERKEINRIGSESGCHTCGTTDPGTKYGNFVLDHQPPSALNPPGGPQRLYPHCLGCSREQGLEIARQLRQGEP